MAYAWMHYASFKTAINILGIAPNEIARRPLVIDIGCGPGTALSAFGEWLCEKRGCRTDIHYVGIDRSEHMRMLAASFVTDSSLFEGHAPALLESSEYFTPEAFDTQVVGRDGVVITMSYVMHQEFMTDGQAFMHIMKTLSSSPLPIWILAQDANKPHIDEANVETWPETRLRAMLNAAEAFGYRSRLWSRRFEARQYTLDEKGDASEQPAQGRHKTKAIAARLERA